MDSSTNGGSKASIFRNDKLRFIKRSNPFQNYLYWFYPR